MSSTSDRKRWADIQLADRVAHFCATWFRTASRETVLEAIDRRLAYIQLKKASRGVLAIAESGGGKTTFLDHLASLYPRTYVNGETKAPLVRMKLPTILSAHNLLTNALAAIGDPEPDVGKSRQRTDRLHGLLKKCNVKILAIDNFHDIPERRRTTIRTVGNWFRDLTDDVPLLLLTLGTKDALDVRIFNTQVRRRLMTVLRMDPFRIDTSDGQAEWIDLLKQINQALPLTEDSELHAKGLRGLLYVACNGSFDYLIELVTHALTAVVLDGREKIDIKDLHDAFVSAHGTISEQSNPFAPGFVLHRLDGPGETFDRLELGTSARARPHTD